MKKSIFLFFAAFLCASSVWAWNVEQGKVFYFKPSSVWKSDGARFAVAFGSGDNTYAWESCVAVSGETDVYYIVSPGNYDWMIFCRMKPSTTNDWANKWNESQRVQPNNNYNKFDLKANWATDFNWYKYAPPMKSASITNTSTVYGGDGTQGNPYQIKKGTSIYVSATATSTVTADNQTIYYKFYKKENSSSRSSVGNESTTSTCSFTTSSTVGTKYAVDVEARNEYYSNYGTKATSSTLYFITIEPIYAILGSFNDWTHSANTWDLSDQGSNNWKATFHLDKGSHTFKVVYNSSYYGKNNTTITRASTTITSLSTSGANINLTTDIAGDYTFTFNSSDKKLTVEYPVWPVFQVTASVNDETMGSVSGAKEYKDGETAKLVATPKAGYVFVNWTDASSAEVVSSDATYSFTVTKAIALVANFEAEKTHEITISHLCNSNPIAGQEDKTQAVGVATYSKITATEITNYAFKNWTVGSGIKAEDENANPISIITLDEGEYTLVANYTKIENTYTVTVPAGTEKCYIAGDMNSWAFREMTPTGNSNEFTITIDGATKDHKYKYTCGDDWKYVEVKADGSNLDDNRKYAANDVVARWNCAPGIHLVGEMNNWNTAANKFVEASSTATVTIALEAGVYKFKVNNDGEWLGNNGTMVRGGDGMDTGWSFESDKDACQLTADIVGDYTFTWNLETKKLTVTYPALPKHQVTATVNPAETGEVTGTGEYEQGSEATLVATPAAGYAFKNWTVGSTEKSTEATYTFTVNEPISLVANFIPEVTHEVTVSYLCNSNPIPGHDATTLAVGVTTPSTITAPAITHYTFDRWTVGTGVQAVDVTANPIQITTLAEGEYTLTANYTKIELTYTVKVPEGTEKCYIAGEMNSWSFQEMTPTANANEFTITIDGATTDHQYKYACGDSWDYVELKEDGSGVADRTYNSNDVVEKWSTLAKCYLMGNGDWENGVEMKYDSENSQYILLCHHISAPFKFKLGDEWSDQVENDKQNGVTWTDEDADGNFDINLPEGDYNFYFKKDSKKVYIEVSTPALTRTIPVGYYATVCLRNNIIKVVGATLFEVAGKDGDRVIFDEVITPVAGMPYIFLTEENQISFYCGIETAATPDNHNSLHGTFEKMTDAELDGMYMVQNNRIVKCAATGCSIPANRAYFNGTELDALGSAPALMPGRRRITMGAESENEATGTEDIITPSVQFTKKIVDGQLIIIRDGVKYNAQGQKL